MNRRMSVGTAILMTNILGLAFMSTGCASRSSAGLDPVLFKYDDFNLTKEARAVLKKNSTALKKQSSGKILIEGHTDERGTNEYNIALGERRAKTTQAYLVEKGIPASRIEVKSWGEEKPVDSAQNEKAFAKNRRAEFVANLSEEALKNN
jgi:peptidoglycan-associated lipoprotein